MLHNSDLKVHVLDQSNNERTRSPKLSTSQIWRIIAHFLRTPPAARQAISSKPQRRYLTYCFGATQIRIRTLLRGLPRVWIHYRSLWRRSTVSIRPLVTIGCCDDGDDLCARDDAYRHTIKRNSDSSNIVNKHRPCAVLAYRRHI